MNGIDSHIIPYMYLHKFSYVLYWRLPIATNVLHVIHASKVSDMLFSYWGQHMEIPDSIYHRYLSAFAIYERTPTMALND